MCVYGKALLAAVGVFAGDLTWTLIANNQPATISLHLRPPYFIEPLRNTTNGNEPPTIRFSQNGEGFTGPPVGIAHRLTATVGTPVELSVWLSDVRPEAAEGRGGGRGGRGERGSALTLRWHLLRGTGQVEFADTSLRVREPDDQNPTTTVNSARPENTCFGPKRSTRPAWAAGASSVAGHRPSCRSPCPTGY